MISLSVKLGKDQVNALFMRYFKFLFFYVEQSAYMKNIKYRKCLQWVPFSLR